MYVSVEASIIVYVEPTKFWHRLIAPDVISHGDYQLYHIQQFGFHCPLFLIFDIRAQPLIQQSVLIIWNWVSFFLEPSDQPLLSS